MKTLCMFFGVLLLFVLLEMYLQSNSLEVELLSHRVNLYVISLGIVKSPREGLYNNACLFPCSLANGVGCSASEVFTKLIEKK